MIQNKYCKQCGKEFKPEKKQSLYCSPECRDNHKRLSYRKKKPVNSLKRTMRVLDRVGMKYSEYQRLEYEGKVNIVGDQLVRS